MNELTVVYDKIDRLRPTANRDLALSLVHAAQVALDDAETPADMKDIRDKLRAFESYFRRQRAQLVESNLVVAQRMRTERVLGAWLKANVDHTGGGNGNNQYADTEEPYGRGTVPEGILRNESSDWQRLASVPDQAFDKWVHENVNSVELSTALALRELARGVIPHVAQNSGENEWYTPPAYIAAAVTVLGQIDLDPASSSIANKIVGATTFYTKKDDGLQKEWRGRVWMNPPYASELITQFASKFARHVGAGDITAGIVLVNNATETAWFRELVDCAAAVLFTAGRVKFLDPEGNPGAPLQGQALIYFGDEPAKFLDAFASFGWGARL